MKRLMFLVWLFSLHSWVAAQEITNGGVETPAEGLAFSDFTDFNLFQSAFGGPLTAIGFDEVPVPTVVTDQFQGQGVTFTDGDDETLASGTFLEDGVGLWGMGRIRIQLSQPARAVGAFFPGGMTIEVFQTQGGPSLHQSADFGGAGSGFFGGVVGGTDFSFVEIRDWVDDAVFIDDLFIGFAPPEGAISGCIEVTGIPLTVNVVGLLQPGEAPQFTLTDKGGCYAFQDPVPDKWFSIVILGTRVPSE